MAEPKQDIRLIQLNNYIRPKVEENKAKNWVLNGKNNSFYYYLIDRYNGSPTNSAIINSYVDMIYGKGIYAKNAFTNTQDWVRFKMILKDSDLRRIVSDFVLFNEFSTQTIKAKNKKDLGAIKHLPKERTAPSIENEDEEIENYWYCRDWKNTNKFPPMPFPAFGTSNESIEIFNGKPYKAGKTYFADPDYLAGLPYMEMEEEISNYYINHIKNGLSFGYIINIPDGNSLTEEEKDELERKIKQKLTGSSNAGKFVLSFNGRDAEITVTPLTVNDAHKQWEYLTSESRQQIMTAHRVTSPMLFGIKDNTGFGNNADELDTAEAQLYKRVIQPKQVVFLEALDDILISFGINLDLYFRPLTEQSTSIQMSEQIEELNDSQLDILGLGETITEDWELVDKREYSEENTSVDLWIDSIKLSVVKSAGNKSSNLDKSIYKVRYSYEEKYSSEKSRGFCTQMMARTRNGVVYRLEDIDIASRKGVNAELGHNGQAYDLFKFKGGKFCGHFWQENLYKLKKGKEDKGLSSSDSVDSIPKTYKPRPIGHLQSKIPPKDMPNGGAYPV